MYCAYKSETRLLGQDNIEFDGYVLIWSGQEEKFQNGVAILMKKKMANRGTFEPRY